MRFLGQIHEVPSEREQVARHNNLGRIVQVTGRGSLRTRRQTANGATSGGKPLGGHHSPASECHGQWFALGRSGRIVGVDDADLEIIRQARLRHMVERNGAQGRLGYEAVRASRFSRRNLEMDGLISSGYREMVILDSGILTTGSSASLIA